MNSDSIELSRSFPDSGGRYREGNRNITEANTVFAGLFEYLETVILVRQKNGSFLVMGQAPDWFSAFFSKQVASPMDLEETFPFLSSFLMDAQPHWQNEQTGALESGFWVELNPQGKEVPLEASALLIDNLPLLLIRRCQKAYQQQTTLLQTGRDAALETLQERKQNAAQLKRSIFYDLPTGLPNQVFLRVQLLQALERLKRGECSPFSLSLLSIEPLKAVNRRYGQNFGDQVLMQVIERLRKHLEPTDLLARLGEDRLVFIPWSLSDQSSIEPFLGTIQQELTLPYQIEHHEVVLQFNIGVAQGTGFQDQPEEILDHASIAMGSARQSEQSHAFFDSAMRLQVIRTSDLERDLPKSIRQQQLLAYYEPVVSLKQKTITGFEALVRWHHPIYGLLAPGSFIPLAETTGFVVPLGEWMLHQACTQVARWNTNFDRALAVQVNLSAKQLSADNLLKTVQEIVRQTPVLPKYLKLEITESMVHQNLASTVEQLQQIKAFGVHICMDDFGTGYSSLNYLHQLPIDTLKIDRSLTQAMNPGSTEILKATVNLAHDLGMDVIAEGVETPEHLERLQKLNCDYAQGYLFSKPMPPHLAQQLLYQPLTIL